MRDIFRAGVFLEFVRLATRAEGPHGAHVRGAKRNRIDRRSRIILPLLFRYYLGDAGIKKKWSQKTAGLGKEAMAEEGGIDLSWPTEARARIIFVLVAPIMLPIVCTVPQPRLGGKARWFIFTFIGSLFSRPYVYRVNSEGLSIDQAILIVMDILIIVLIILQGWTMTKPLGFFVFGLYARFLVQAICREYE